MGAGAPAGRGRTGLTFLVCPYCDGALTVQGRVAACADRHTFDVARSGYLNLLPGGRPVGRHEGDSRAMVQARQRFCDAGHYRPLAERLAQLCAGQPAEGYALDAGGGTGYFLDGAAVDVRGFVSDLSRDAADIGARRYPALCHVVADTRRRLPFAARRAALVLDVFAPRNPAEFHRLLQPEGLLLVVIPAPDHIRELRARYHLIGLQEDKKGAVLTGMSEHFTQVADDALTYRTSLDGPALADLVAMGPSARHLDPAAIERLRQGDGASAAFCFDLLGFRPS